MRVEVRDGFLQVNELFVANLREPFGGYFDPASAKRSVESRIIPPSECYTGEKLKAYVFRHPTTPHLGIMTDIYTTNQLSSHCIYKTNTTQYKLVRTKFLNQATRNPPDNLKTPVNKLLNLLNNSHKFDSITTDIKFVADFFGVHQISYNLIKFEGEGSRGDSIRELLKTYGKIPLNLLQQELIGLPREWTDMDEVSNSLIITSTNHMFAGYIDKCSGHSCLPVTLFKVNVSEGRRT